MTTRSATDSSPPREYRQDGYLVSTDRGRLDLGVIHGFLREAYWCRGIPRAVVEKSIAHSLCFGVYHGADQVGFARWVTDCATFAYLGDVFILASHRGRGLSKWLMECMMTHPDFDGLRRFVLATADAHGLYAQSGFVPLAKPEMFMEIADPEVYLK